MSYALRSMRPSSEENTPLCTKCFPKSAMTPRWEEGESSRVMSAASAR